MASIPDMIAELDDYGFEDTADTRKVAQINNAIWDICSREPWPFLEKEISLNFDGVSATPTNLPSDLSAVLKITNTTTGQRVNPIRLDDLEDNYATQITTVGTPQVYYFLADDLNLTPIPPAATGQWRMKYISWPAAVNSLSLESSIVIPARHHQAIMYGTLARLNAMEDDSELGDYFEAKGEKKIQLMRNDLWRHHYDGPDFIHQVEDYDYYYIG